MGRLSAVLLVVMLVMVTDIGPMVGEAKTCDVLSDKFPGACFNNAHCDSVCRTKEGLISGYCGTRFHCFCVKNC